MAQWQTGPGARSASNTNVTRHLVWASTLAPHIIILHRLQKTDQDCPGAVKDIETVFQKIVIFNIESLNLIVARLKDLGYFIQCCRNQFRSYDFCDSKDR